MNSFKEGLRLINEKDDMIKDAKEGRYALTVEITKFCPIKVGDRHQIVRDTNRYVAHVGKTFVVDAIRFHRGWPGDGFVISGYIIKADGTVGKVRGEQLIFMPK